jgi:acyl-[acyl-carrier-protein]-phospholipid O-acyltransferase/long-chain-fatty-acid--[acyl-carrier-protein] ligase|tara:strand:+ start:56754 stop:58334 length:1581 start_codon:yes stop_codon:yes gene_type:complete
MSDLLENHPDVNKSLAELGVRGLKRNFFGRQFVDLSTGRRELRAGMVLALSLTFSDLWRERLKNESRVGVVLPSGLGSLLVNLTLQILGKTPVNLNFTAGRAVNEKCLAKADIETVISAAPVIEKLPDFPWPEQMIDLVQERDRVGKFAVIKNLLRGWALPVARLVDCGRSEEEATILFSSGTTGDPKGVVLTQRNVVANLLQIEAVGLLDSKEVLLASLPTFHSFGFTVTQWYPLISGMKVVSLPSPLETKRLGKAIRDEKVTVMMSTPTFLKPFLKRVPPEWIESLKFVVVGAEKSPEGLPEKWEETFGSTYLEGYGLTEASPVVSCNLLGKSEQETTRRHGTVGRLFIGIEARIVDPEEGRPLAKSEIGMLELRGPNFFDGYLNDAGKTNEVFRDGWYVTGDLARFDPDGFLIIEGRLSRFSKMGGEMVPHGAVEEAIIQAFDLEDAELPQIAVAGVQDPAKGEALVLLAVPDIEPAELREQLSAKGLPNLWVPKRIVKVDTIPTLGTGKLDLKGVTQVAENG